MLDQIVREAARRFEERLAYVGSDGPLSYRQLDDRSDRVAGGFTEVGVGLGSVVALTRASDADYLVTLAAISKIGAISVGINPSLAPAEQEALLGFLEPDLVVGADTELPDGRAAPSLAPDPDRIATIVCTSGTTGRPKAAWFRSRELAAVRDIDLGEGAASWGGGGPMLASTQFSHIGISTKLSWYLQTGSTLIRVEPWRADDVLRAVSEYRISSIGGVAPQMALLLRSPLIDSLDLSCVTSFIVGGALSTPSLVEQITLRFNASYSIRYSCTESGGVGLGTNPSGGVDETTASIGRPRPGVEARLIDPTNGAVLPDGATGELCVRSAAQMVGYWKAPEDTARALRDGWIHTGDLARREPNGLYRLRGRIKEQYVRGGYNVSPAEVEAVLSSHPLVREVVVAPRADDVMGEVGVAIVVPMEPGQPPTLEDLRTFGAERLATWKLPEAIVAVEALPLTAMQKLDRAAAARIAR